LQVSLKKQFLNFTKTTFESTHSFEWQLPSYPDWSKPLLLCHRETNNLPVKLSLNGKVLHLHATKSQRRNRFSGLFISPSALDGDYLSHSRYGHFTPR